MVTVQDFMKISCVGFPWPPTHIRIHVMGFHHDLFASVSGKTVAADDFIENPDIPGFIPDDVNFPQDKLKFLLQEPVFHILALPDLKPNWLAKPEGYLLIVKEENLSFSFWAGNFTWPQK